MSPLEASYPALKEIQKNTNKKLEEIIKSLKELKQTQANS